MHFLVLLWQLVLRLVGDDWRDGLTMAARSDGRIEHLPHRPSLWDRLWSWSRRNSWRREPAERVRAGRAPCNALRLGTPEPEAPC
jgi:hypothetical protein